MDGIGEVTRRLEELAEARVNDTVKLAFIKNEQIGKIDALELTALTELRHNVGGVEAMKFIDWLAVLENLGVMGVPFPAFLKGALEALRDRGDRGSKT